MQDHTKLDAKSGPTDCVRSARPQHEWAVGRCKDAPTGGCSGAPRGNGNRRNSLELSVGLPVNHTMSEEMDRKRTRILVSQEGFLGASLVAQQLRIRLPMQGTRVRALAREDPTCRGATKPVHHNY